MTERRSTQPGLQLSCGPAATQPRDSRPHFSHPCRGSPAVGFTSPLLPPVLGEPSSGTHVPTSPTHVGGAQQRGLETEGGTSCSPLSPQRRLQSQGESKPLPTPQQGGESRQSLQPGWCRGSAGIWPHSLSTLVLPPKEETARSRENWNRIRASQYNTPSNQDRTEKSPFLPRTRKITTWVKKTVNRHPTEMNGKLECPRI